MGLMICLCQGGMCSPSASTVFPQLDALHVLDASACFDAGLSGRNTF